EVGDVARGDRALPDSDEPPVLPPEPVDPTLGEERAAGAGQVGGDLPQRQDVLEHEHLRAVPVARHRNQAAPDAPDEVRLAFLDDVVPTPALVEREGDRGAAEAVTAGPEPLPGGRPRAQVVVAGEG